MKSALFFILFGFFCLLIQGSLISSWPPARLHLEIVLLIALYLGFFGTTISGLWIIIILGTMVDLVGSPSLGLMTVIY
ncbi:MAG: hypothetical protein Q7S98_03190, partial [Deltaproteobacteria bacterium]|nr:hypothetical protein [Deltaproteobacteria bacterium]